MTARRLRRVALHAFLMGTALAFLLPLLYALYTSFRPYEDTARHGYVSLPHVLTFENFTNAWRQGAIPEHFLNTLIIVGPSLVLILLFSSSIAFGISRYRIPGRKILLIVFTAGNLLPQQILLTPLYQFYQIIDDTDFMYYHNWHVYDSYWGVIAIHVAFQTGFCTFVLANYMQALPEELTEAALVDGAGAWRQYWKVTLPLCRAPLAALATLEFTWIYNDFLWALVLMTTGSKRPITSALQNLKGQFFTDNNLLAAGSLIIALPTMIVYFALQRHFVRGLTLGATKG